MATKMNAFIVHETGKHYIVSPVAAYISITDMLQKRKEIPAASFMKISKKLVQSMRITHPYIRGNSFLTVSEIGKTAVTTVHGCEFMLA